MNGGRYRLDSSGHQTLYMLTIDPMLEKRHDVQRIPKARRPTRLLLHAIGKNGSVAGACLNHSTTNGTTGDTGDEVSAEQRPNGYRARRGVPGGELGPQGSPPSQKRALYGTPLPGYSRVATKLVQLIFHDVQEKDEKVK
ncbi:hypothetical protein KIN20_004097 [Parelaphostrongylus tenuis]|uniref:Uncharacterized protein n=1 Tax=Parelaphostrongylus tenuis TaxID=148309 RepID=A0AAD5M186_PARTN|nr:hypothetical protein KIN20_004097 [Parelaphostrongylus tenuis]